MTKQQLREENHELCRELIAYRRVDCAPRDPRADYYLSRSICNLEIRISNLECSSSHQPDIRHTCTEHEPVIGFGTAFICTAMVCATLLIIL